MIRAWVIAVIVVLGPGLAGAEEMKPDALAKRVGQVFAGYDDFYVWVTQRFEDADRKVTRMRGRVYFKREKMFRLNFGQPPTLIDGTDGDVYWRYYQKENVVEYTKLDEHTPAHILFQVFAAGNQMVKALDRFFNVEELKEEAFGEGEKKTPTYKLVISLKPERVKEMRTEGNKFAPVEGTRWTLWVDKTSYLPWRIQIDWASKHRDTFDLDLDTFQSNVGLSEKLFRMPRPAGVTVREMKTE